MSVLSIRKVPEDVARALKRLAGARGLSVESLARGALIDLVRPSLDRQEAEFWTDLRSELRPGDADALIRACRELDREAYEPPTFE